MKKYMYFILSLFITSYSLVAQVNRTETVRFARGTSGAVLTRTLAARGSNTFVLNARRNQTINFTIGYDFADGDLEGFLKEPNTQTVSLNAAPKAPHEFKIKRTGNHQIVVNNKTRRRVTFTLYVDVE